MAFTLRDRVRYHLLVRLLPAYLRPKHGDDLVPVGTGYGVWWVPKAALRPGAVAYCAGAGEDISFDVELHERGLNVRTFDPTPRAIAYAEANGPTNSDRFTFLPVGWWSETDTLKFYVPADLKYVSHSAVNLQKTEDYFEARVRSPAELMRELGDEHVDIVKMDIEGAEYAVIESMLRDGPLPDVWCIEFDQPQPPRRTIRAVRSIEAAGYTLRRVDEWNYVFTRT